MSQNLDVLWVRVVMLYESKFLMLNESNLWCIMSQNIDIFVDEKKITWHIAWHMGW